MDPSVGVRSRDHLAPVRNFATGSGDLTFSGGIDQVALAGFGVAGLEAGVWARALAAVLSPHNVR